MTALDWRVATADGRIVYESGNTSSNVGIEEVIIVVTFALSKIVALPWISHTLQEKSRAF